jgi:hypothetical protein
MTLAADYAVKRTELLDKLSGVLREFRQAMIVNGARAPQEYVAWWGGLDRGIVGATERGHRDIQFANLRQILAAYNATWVMLGAAMDDVDTVEIVPIAAARRRGLETVRAIGGRPLLRPLAITLRDRRLELGQTQEAMAYMGGLDRGFVASVERAERSIRFLTLRQVLRVYRMTWATLGKTLHQHDAIPRYETFPAWPGTRNSVQTATAPPWGPARAGAWRGDDVTSMRQTQ